jgi:hypothetical protein
MGAGNLTILAPPIDLKSLKDSPLAVQGLQIGGARWLQVHPFARAKGHLPVLTHPGANPSPRFALSVTVL